MNAPKKVTRTTSLPLSLSKEQTDLLHATIKTYSALWQDVVSYSKTNKVANKFNIQKSIYHSLRENHPEALSQSVVIAIREGAAAVKSWNSNNPKRKWQLKAQRRSLSIPVDARLFSIRGNLLTLSTMTGQPRIRTTVPAVPEWFSQRYPDTKVSAATVHISRGGAVYINLIHTVSFETTPRTADKVVGIDRGLYKIAVTSEGGEYTGSQVRAQRRKMMHNRRTLQQKGTRSARNRLRAMSGREKRFMRDVNHVISKKLAQDETVKTYVLEDLTGIRSRAGRGKKMRTWLGNWAFCQLEQFLTYKCEVAGVEVTSVSPAYTSQDCNGCHYRDRKNRRKGLFLCRKCGNKDNADLNAAKNIRDKYILSALVGGAGLNQQPVMDGVPEINLLAEVSGLNTHVQTPPPCGRG